MGETGETGRETWEKTRERCTSYGPERVYIETTAKDVHVQQMGFCILE